MTNTTPSAPTSKRQPGRPATGSLVWTKKGWAARITTTVDGERVRMQRQLETTNKLAAQRKLERLLASEAPAPTAALPGETFQQAAERVHAQRVRDGVANAGDELARLRLYAFPSIGQKPAAAVVTADVNQSLDFCKAEGKSRQTVAHLRQALRLVFDVLRRES
jgi:ATP-dependent DNA ligase